MHPLRKLLLQWPHGSGGRSVVGEKPWTRAAQARCCRRLGLDSPLCTAPASAGLDVGQHLRALCPGCQWHPHACHNRSCLLTLPSVPWGVRERPSPWLRTTAVDKSCFTKARVLQVYETIFSFWFLMTLLVSMLVVTHSSVMHSAVYICMRVCVFP